MRLKIVIAAFAAMPIAALATSTGPPPLRTGAPVDANGITCTACHGRNADFANADRTGGMEILLDALSYRPGQTQTIKVRVFHPEQLRWGFQLAARPASDLTKQAGTFTATTDIRVRCVTGDAPCDGGLEFASHRSAPRTAAGAGFTFEVQWTAPATDVGDVVLYAAGNAANGDGGNGGALDSDKIYTTVRTLSAPCGLTAKPTVTAVTDAASFRTAWAPNSLITLFGTNFAGATARRNAEAFDLASGFPKELGCVAVEMGGTRVPITHVSAGQINVQGPTTGQNSGNVPITVILNPGRPNEVKSDIVANNGLARFSPALFVSGTTAIAQVGGTATLINDARPARPGEIITLYATGLGYTNPVWQAGEIPSRVSPLQTPATVTIGGAAATVEYAGVAVGNISGLYQINVRVPTTAANGNQPVVVAVGGATSPTTITIPVRAQ